MVKFYTKVMAFAAIFILFGFTAQAGLIRGTIGQGNVNGSQAYGIDFNNDGNLEFVIQSMGNYTNNVVMIVSSNNVDNIWTQSSGYPNEGWDHIAALTAGTSIGSNGVWGSAGDAYLADPMDVYVPVNEVFYVGFRVAVNGGVRYGYAKVKLNGTTAQWMECYLQEMPNQPIAAGAGGGTGINEVAEQQVSIFPNPTADIVRISAQVAENETVAVYDMNGRKVNAEVVIENGQIVADLTSCKAGVYFVRWDNNSCKVVRK